MGMELTKTEISRALESPANQPTLPASELERFDAHKLSVLLEHEIRKAEAAGLSHIRINLNLVDCTALSRALRRAALAGE
jgi:hypothetical protein